MSSQRQGRRKTKYLCRKRRRKGLKARKVKATFPPYEMPYTPRDDQLPFHQSSAPIRYLRGGVGAGKTIAGAAEAIQLSYDNRPADGMLIAPTWNILTRVSLREFQKLAKPWIMAENKQEKWMEMCWGAKVFYASADNPFSLEGSNLGWAWLDEPRYMRRESWNITNARVRGHFPRKSIILTSTPSMGWLYDEFGDCSQDEDREDFLIRTADNFYIDVDPFLARLKKSYSEAVYRQYVNAEYGVIEGAVFPTFSTDIHVQHDLEMLGYPVLAALDPGYRKPSSMFMQVFPWCHRHNVPDCLHVIGEINPDDTPTSQLAPMMRQLCARSNWDCTTCYVDPAANARSVQTGIRDVDIMEHKDNKFICEWTTDPACRDIPNGIEAIRSKILDAGGATSLYIDSHLMGNKRGIINALQMSQYPKRREDTEYKEHPLKDGEFEHSRDALRYAIVNLFDIGASLIGTV